MLAEANVEMFISHPHSDSSVTSSFSRSRRRNNYLHSIVCLHEEAHKLLYHSLTDEWIERQQCRPPPRVCACLFMFEQSNPHFRFLDFCRDTLTTEFYKRDLRVLSSDIFILAWPPQHSFLVVVVVVGVILEDRKGRVLYDFNVYCLNSEESTSSISSVISVHVCAKVYLQTYNLWTCRKIWAEI